MSNPPPACQSAASAPSTPPRVLVVDDVQENREILAYYLGKLGFDVITTQDGFMAVEGLSGGAARRRGLDRPPSFDLVLMDISMPRLDGFQAVATLRAQGIRTPIVAVTASTVEGCRDRCLAAGYDDFIAKPVEPELLRSVCTALLASSGGNTAAA
jgi:CheY-like chemotaxis protein